MQTTSRSLGRGIGCLKTGFSLMLKPGVRSYFFLPLLLNIVIFGGLIWWGVRQYQHLLLWLNHYLPHWLDPFLWLLFFIVIGIALSFFVSVANMIASPFNSLLSARVFKYLHDSKALALPAKPQVNLATDMWHSVTRQFSILKYYLPRALLLLIISFIPGVNIIGGVVWYVFNAWFLFLQYMDYPMEIAGINFRDMRRILAAHYAAGLGFGFMVLALAFIPVLNILLMPAAVAGATLYYATNVD